MRSLVLGIFYGNSIARAIDGGMLYSASVYFVPLCTEGL